MPDAAGPAAGAEEARTVLRRWAADGGALATRARVVLLAEEGVRDAEIARRLGVSRQTVGTWRHRWRATGLAGLEQRPRTGRPVTVDEAEVVTRGLLLPDGGPCRAVARELGLSHATVAAVRRRWGLAPGAVAAPVVPTRPPLPAAACRVLGLYADPRRCLLLTGAAAGAASGAAASGAAASGLDPGRLGRLDRALDAVRTRAGAFTAGDPTPLVAAARARHPGLELHALTLWGDDLPPVSGATAHRLPARSTWRGVLRLLVALDAARDPGRARPLHPELLAALEHGGGAGPVRWLREPARTGGAPRSTTGGTEGM